MDNEVTRRATKALLQAAEELGESITDINGKEQKGTPVNASYLTKRATNFF